MSKKTYEPVKASDAINGEFTGNNEKDKPGYEACKWCYDIFEKNKNAVVLVQCHDADKVCCGTGVIISENGYFLTAADLLYNPQTGKHFQKKEISFIGNSKSYPMDVLFSDTQTGIALCSFDIKKVCSFGVVKRIADYGTLKQGDACVVIEDVFIANLKPFNGVVLSTKNKGNLVHTVPMVTGDLGGPVFDKHGECIGINKSIMSIIDNNEIKQYTNAIPMDVIDALLKKWCDANGIKL